jgi:hypothetical protein
MPICAIHFNPAGLRGRAKQFIKLPLPRNKYKQWPIATLNPLTLDGTWPVVARYNAAAAARSFKQKAVLKQNICNLASAITWPVITQKNKCVLQAYDQWFDRTALALKRQPQWKGTYGRAQKFLNLYVKYIYCAERSGAIIPHGPPAGWTLNFECALHAPLDRRVLTNLMQAFRGTVLWPSVRPWLCQTNPYHLKAWSVLTQQEYFYIHSLLRRMIMATWPVGHRCLRSNINPLFTDRSEVETNYCLLAVVQKILKVSEVDPIVSTLDFEMRGLWNPNPRK